MLFCVLISFDVDMGNCIIGRNLTFLHLKGVESEAQMASDLSQTTASPTAFGQATLYEADSPARVEM